MGMFEFGNSYVARSMFKEQNITNLKATDTDKIWKGSDFPCESRNIVCYLMEVVESIS